MYVCFRASRVGSCCVSGVMCMDLDFGYWVPEQILVLQCYRTMASDWLQHRCVNILWQGRNNAVAAGPIPLAAVV